MEIALADMTIEQRVKAVSHDFSNHKWREGEYYDRYLERLLRKYDISLADYYAYDNEES